MAMDGSSNSYDSPANKKPNVLVVMAIFHFVHFPLVMTNIAMENGHRNSDFFY
jgi:hypothetical protein